MKTTKKILAIIIAIVVMTMAMPMTASATTAIQGTTVITFPSGEVIEVESTRTGRNNPVLEVAEVAEQLGIPTRNAAGVRNNIRALVGQTSKFNIADDGYLLELIVNDDGATFLERITLVGTCTIGTSSFNPLHWEDIEGNVEAIHEGRGHVFANVVRNIHTDVWVVVDGDRHGSVQFGNSVMTEYYQSVEIARGEIAVIRMYGATFWAQQEPIAITDFVFRTGGDNVRQADNRRFGWVWTPDQPVEFAVPSDQNIRVIQAYDPRIGEVRQFRPGEVAYVGVDGATFWFRSSRTASPYATSFTRDGEVVYW